MISLTSGFAPGNMSWTDVYLVCFWLGFLLSAVSWLLGAVMPHMAHLPHLPHAPHAPHAPHVPHATGQPAPSHGAGAHGGDVNYAPSFLNFATATAFLAWFGGAGYLLTRYADVWPIAALLMAIVAGVAGAALVFVVMAKVLWSPHENLDPADYDLVGLLGVVSSPIREGGTGEILFPLEGARRVIGARSEDGSAIAKGVEVVIVRYQNGLAYVRTWAELASDDART
jgi:membrane protein implicated in regulation of membrane protease activity